MQESLRHPNNETGLAQLVFSLAGLSGLGRHLKREVVWVDGDDVCHGEEDAFVLPGNRICSARANGCKHLCRGRSRGGANLGLLAAGGPPSPHGAQGVGQLFPERPPQSQSGEIGLCPLPCPPGGPYLGARAARRAGRTFGELSALLQVQCGSVLLIRG